MVSKKFTLEHDWLIVQHYDAVGDLLETDMPQSWPSIQKRAKLLKDTGVWEALTRAQRFAWIALRERLMLSPTKELIDLDAMHPGSMIDACHYNDLVTAKEYASETEGWFADCKVMATRIECSADRLPRE
ncbi:MAG: hypothetical protein AAF468_06410 [Pseudomonadota bacterium]